ncbi:polyprenyl synthetase family protein [Luteipulveratus mongoliensis]|uniref:Geranylgeranyl pyrophosphate synthase n=1 Tax=Luteipulveratus mongoliensis TaxID=571913 RepID=A0A0K1JMW7_9MICO|nr:polyprenyl synthetase family protein [Luteipulveratus mongoliensis]AKU17920.1 geranylgeranyl pyrophosphate synthase [Luteipulveratus mongoliensis]
MTAAALTALPGASAELTSRLQEGLSAVEVRLRQVVDHDDPFIARASSHLIEGGKRFRPMLTLLAAELGEGRSDDVVDAATGVELTHMASLYHDDVMDEADVRHGIPSANATYDNSTAILVGDLLFGKASEIVAGLGSEAVLIQAQTFVRLCAGQIQDDRQAPAGADPMQHYLQVLADKTGVLIATAARYGAKFGRCPESTVDLMREYGELVGMVFQLSDDILDITSDQEQSGKTPGTDLREGVATLPVLYARASQDPADARLQELLAGELTDDALHAETLGLLRQHEAIDQAREHTIGLAQRAADLIGTLGAGDAQDALRGLPLAVAHRTT